MKLFKTLIIAISAVALASCNDFIDVPPTGTVDEETAMELSEYLVLGY